MLYRAEPTAEQGVPHCWKTPFRYTTGTQEGLSTPCWGRPHCIAPEADTASWAGPSHGMSHGLCQHPVPGPKTWLQPQPGSKEKAAAHQKALQGAQWGMAELEVPRCWRGAGSTPLPCHPAPPATPALLFWKDPQLSAGTTSTEPYLMKAVHWLLGSWFHLPPLSF